MLLQPMRQDYSVWLGSEHCVGCALYAVTNTFEASCLPITSFQAAAVWAVLLKIEKYNELTRNHIFNIQTDWRGGSCDFARARESHMVEHQNV